MEPWSVVCVAICVWSVKRTRLCGLIMSESTVYNLFPCSVAKHTASRTPTVLREGKKGLDLFVLTAQTRPRFIPD